MTMAGDWKPPKYDIHIFQTAVQMVRDAARELEALPPETRDRVRPLIYAAVERAYKASPKCHDPNCKSTPMPGWWGPDDQLNVEITGLPEELRMRMLPVAMKAVVGMTEACNALYRPRNIKSGGSDSNWETDRDNLPEYIEWFKRLPERMR